MGAASQTKVSDKALMKQEQKPILENPVSPLQKVQQVFCWGFRVALVVDYEGGSFFFFLVSQGSFPMSMAVLSLRTSWHYLTLCPVGFLL